MELRPALLPLRRQGSFLVAADGHHADPQLACDAPQRGPFQHPQAQDRGLMGRKPLQQLFGGTPETFRGCCLFALRGGEVVEVRALVGTEGIEALMAPGMDALLVLTAGRPAPGGCDRAGNVAGLPESGT